MAKPEGERYTIACDFDGVLHSYTSPWVAPEHIPDPPVEGAIDWLNSISLYLDIIIFTTRGSTPEGQDAVRTWLARHGFTLWNHVQVTDRKPPALVYLDDRAIRFNGPGSFPSFEEVYKARPWNKK